MRTATFFLLVPLGLALTTLVPSRAEAQRRSQVIVCRDGTRSYSDDVRVCARHRGLDVRATEEARRYENDRSANGRWDNRRDDRGGDDRRSGDDRYGYGTGGRTEVYEWQGTVDKEIQIQLRGNRASVQPIGAGDMRAGRGHVINGLPQRNGTLVVQRLAGRGDVDVIEQPSSRNGYTATIRIRDSRGGADNYRIAVYFESSSNGDGRYGDGRYGRN
jgi:hypothetical protein